ncbi:SapC family protein [Colwellia sp. D2M02]|uniref:SapC family protein n=1 Tax=Colwellia asteriadis TaxID=517723 RepID=A0ABN1L3W5_9GAMM|nr:SapC family protein [Colwellia sp. D2M02]MBU2891778.1 SapC family protein [Colwellia sp. D2M02]
MANFVPVRKEQHQNLKLATQRNLAHVANQHIVPVTAAEYAQASASFPVVLVKNPDSPRYRSIAMLGLESGENLFYQDEKWTGLSVPLSIGMAPFALGIDPDKENTLTACIDVDSEFVGEDKDIALYDAEGKETETLTNVQQSLGRLYDNERMTENFIKELEENNLLQELQLNIDLSNGEKKKLVGIFTINEDKIRDLSDEKVVDFHKRGLFVPIYAMLGSLGQINRLVQLRNLTSATKVTSVQMAPVAQEEAKAETAES